MKNIFFYFSIICVFSSLCCFAQDAEQTTKLNLKLPEIQSNVVDHCMRFDKQNQALTKLEFKKKEVRVVRDFYFDSVNKKINDAINQISIPEKVVYANKLIKATAEVTIADTGDLCSVRILESNSDEYSKRLIDSINKAAPFAPFPAEMSSETSLIRTFGGIEYDATRRIRYY